MVGSGARPEAAPPLTRRVPHVRGEPGAKSFVDDLILGRGFVRSRAAPSLRSIESQPSTQAFVAAGAEQSRAERRRRLLRRQRRRCPPPFPLTRPPGLGLGRVLGFAAGRPRRVPGSGPSGCGAARRGAGLGDPALAALLPSSVRGVPCAGAGAWKRGGVCGWSRAGACQAPFRPVFPHPAIHPPSRFVAARGRPGRPSTRSVGGCSFPSVPRVDVSSIPGLTCRPVAFPVRAAGRRVNRSGVDLSAGAVSRPCRG